MKKLFVFLLSVLLVCTCASAVSAAEAKYSTAGDLYQSWGENIPDYICGMWSTDGSFDKLTFGIQNNAAGNAGKQEMLDLVENDASLTFVYQVFSRNYLLQIQGEIYEYFQKDLGLVSTGLDEINNCITLGILEERKDDKDTQNMIKEITRKYGDAVRVEYTGEIYPMTAKAPYAQAFPVLATGITVICLIGTVLIVNQRKRLLLLQTDNGTTVSATASHSAKAVEEMVKKSNYTVNAALDQKIMGIIEETPNG